MQYISNGRDISRIDTLTNNTLVRGNVSVQQGQGGRLHHVVGSADVASVAARHSVVVVVIANLLGEKPGAVCPEEVAHGVQML